MIKSLKFEDVKNFINELGYELLSDKYVNNSTKLILKDREGYYYTVGFSSLTSGHIPKFVYPSNPYSIDNIKLWCKLNNKPFELISDQYEYCDKKLRWQCLKEDCREIFESSWTSIFQEHGCRYCIGQETGLSNCLATKRPDLAAEWHPTKNGDLTPYDVTCGNNKYAWWKCKDCDYEWKAFIYSRALNNYKCTNCSDKISYPNKFGRSLFVQLNIDYQTEYSPNWIKPKRYDFYFELNNEKYIVEMDGGLGHGNYNKLSRQTAEESKLNDEYKDQKAKEHGIKVIRVNCSKSEMEYIRDNILNSELNQIFDLNNVDWLKCHDFALNNLVKQACELWDKGIKNTTEIGNIMGLEKSTIRKYLNKGVKLGWCDYNPKEIMINNGKISSKKSCKTVIQLTLDQKYITEFESTCEAERKTGIYQGNISICCLGRLKTAGGYKWIYKSDYEKIIS